LTDLISAIVTTYNREDALGVVLDALARQTDSDFEVIVADDGSEPATAELVARRKPDFARGLRHVWQPHRGFRAGEIRDRGILASRGAYCIFLDGDCVPRTDFVARHRRLAEPGSFVTGNRVLLSAKLTRNILENGLRPGDWPLSTWMVKRLRGDANRLLPLLHLPFGPLRKLKASAWRGARSCNMAVWRADLETVDGFDCAFTGWGREDSDLALRLLHAGIRRKQGSFATGVLHLWHPPADLAQLPANDDLLRDVVAARAVRARSGLSALRDGITEPEKGAPAAPALRELH
jgi:glycosyltransferase involved in cell wall biosynthesis